MDRSLCTTKLIGAESMDGSVCPRTKAVPDESDARKVEVALLEGAQRLPVLPRDGNVPRTPPSSLTSPSPPAPRQSAFLRGTCLLLIRKNPRFAKGNGCGSTRALTTSNSGQDPICCCFLSASASCPGRPGGISPSAMEQIRRHDDPGCHAESRGAFSGRF